jgi:hypothetical protein
MLSASAVPKMTENQTPLTNLKEWKLLDVNETEERGM